MPFPHDDGGSVALSVPAAPVRRQDELSHVLRMMRLLLTAVDHAGPDGFALTADSALVSLLRRLMAEASGSPHTSRTAMMALRDLAFRVEAARILLAERFGSEVGAESDRLLDTADIRAFLDQEMQSASPV